METLISNSRFDFRRDAWRGDMKAKAEDLRQVFEVVA